MNKITRLHVTAGYAGRGRVEAQIEGSDEWHVIDSDHFESVMTDLFNTKGVEVTKSNRQKYPRITLNGKKKTCSVEGHQKVIDDEGVDLCDIPF